MKYKDLLNNNSIIPAEIRYKQPYEITPFPKKQKR